MTDEERKGRPPTRPQRKTTGIVVKMSPEQHEMLKQHAVSIGLPLSAWMLSVALKAMAKDNFKL